MGMTIPGSKVQRQRSLPFAVPGGKAGTEILERRAPEEVLHVALKSLIFFCKNMGDFYDDYAIKVGLEIMDLFQIFD